MAKVFFAIALVAFLAQSQGFPRNLKLLQTRIVGGTEAFEGSVPHQISLRYFGSHICGGSILNANTILTAAHCSDYPVSSYSVYAGTNDRNPAPDTFQQSNVASVVVHPEYDAFTIYNDIAVMKLATPFTLDVANKTKAVTLPPKGHIASGDSTITGWGTTSEGGSSANRLRTVTVPIVTDAVCREAYGESDVADSMICAGDEAGGKDSCQGDSGGPMMEDETGFQIGVVSWGYGCARPGYPGVYTEVSYFIDFISDNL